MVSQPKNQMLWLFQIPSPRSDGMTFGSNPLSLPQSHAQSTHALQTLLSMLREAAHYMKEPTSLVLWQASMANHLVRFLATRRTLVWCLYQLPQWVGMSTSLMQRGGSCTPNLADQPQQQQAEGQGEEAPLLPGEERDRRGTGEEREQKATLLLDVVFLSTWASYDLLYPYENIALPIWLSFY